MFRVYSRGVILAWLFSSFRLILLVSALKGRILSHFGTGITRVN